MDTVAERSISNISTDLESSLERKVSAPELPNIFAAYGDTAEDVEEAEKPVSISDYMSDGEMAEYVDDYTRGGSLHDHAYIGVSPIAKAMEVMAVNKSIWDEFAKKENVKFSGLDTWEGLARVSEEYHTYNGGRAFFTRDALMNYLGVGSEQLDTPLFSIIGHTGSFTVSRETMRKLWDQYYVPFVKGYYVKNGRFANGDMKTEDVVACASSSAGTIFFPEEVVRDDGAGYTVEYIVRGVPNLEGEKSYTIVQGAGMAVSKSDEAREYASIQLPKWFTEKERSTLFSVGSFYLPVKKKTNSFASWSTTTEAEKVIANQLARDTVKTFMETVSASILTSQKSLSGSYGIRNHLETALNGRCATDARQIQQAVESKDNREKTWKPYLSGENFNTWLEQIIKDISEKMKDSDT